MPKRKEPSTTRVAMRCYVATGADIPCQASVIRMGLNFRMSVRISIGSEVLETRAVENASGVCEVKGVGGGWLVGWQGPAGELSFVGGEVGHMSVCLMDGVETGRVCDVEVAFGPEGR